MAELWGDDDYLYGAYLKWQRRPPVFHWFLGLVLFATIAYGLWELLRL